MVRMLRPKIDWIPGATGIHIKGDVVETDLDDLVLKWLKFCKTKYSLSGVTVAQLEKLVSENSPEIMLKEYLETH